MKKILFILLFCILVVVAGGIIYIKSNPPLTINGYTSIGNGDIRLIEIENIGLSGLYLQNIIVNEYELPKRAELVVSKIEQIVNAENLENNSTFTYHKLKQVEIIPSQYIDRKAIGQQAQHYGLKIEATNVQKITLYYKYLHIPFTLTVELKTKSS